MGSRTEIHVSITRFTDGDSAWLDAFLSSVGIVSIGQQSKNAYVDLKGRFALDLPEGWKKVASEQDPEYVMFEKNGDLVAIDFAEPGHGKWTAETLPAVQVEALRSEFPGATFVERSVFKAGGYDGAIVLYDLKGLQMFAACVILPAGGVGLQGRLRSEAALHEIKAMARTVRPAGAARSGGY